MKVRLFSYGGSGLKFLTMFLNKYISVYDLSHAPHSQPNKNHLLIDRIIFLYSDPRDSLLSFYRREQRKKGWINMHNKHLQTGINVAKRVSLSGLIDKDGLGLDNHFRKWLDFNHPKIAFVKYEYLNDSIKELLEFLGLDKNIASDFKNVFRTRESNYNTCDEYTQGLLNKCYKELIELQNSLPGFYIKKDKHD